MLCHCKSTKVYALCCRPIILGQIPARTAEELMRSRYSAYCIADVDYLMQSHHTSTRPIKDKSSILRWTKSVSWLGLQIISKKAGGPTDNEGWVEFKATYLENGLLQCIHEHSYFVKEKGLWYYQSGVHQ